MKFVDHDPNFFESDAHAVPAPHHCSSRTVKVALTNFTSADRRLARLTNRCRVLRSTASDSLCLPVATTRLMPMFVPSANSTSSSRQHRTSVLVTSLVATEANSPVNPVANSDSLRMSSRSMVPHLCSISAFKATRFSGSSCLPSGEILIHGSPRRVVTSTPPVVPSSSAVSRRASASRSFFSSASVNAVASSGFLIAL
nr:hypothetical protein [Streptomyces graminofaciens]